MTELHGRPGPAVRPWTMVSETGFTAPSGHLRLATRRYRLPDGRDSDWDVVIGGRTVAVLALTPDGRVLLVRQFRPGPGLILDEMPGGYVDDGEDVAAAALRELREETGFAGEVEVLGGTYLSATATTVRHVAVARDCVRVGLPSPGEDEFCEPRLVSLADFRAQLRAGALTDTDLGYQALDLLGLLH
ncbi:NUDIX hydrolase [uncultured Cellulomonas sp.]|uniref:NUDIX hydrolase n=1 Tax=uncultured Cellulomonas sp. TaxID=189682 RepID=UPI0028EB8434|nr:NUDIX hydrolase [uncultured Cellulomonas sp.]